MCLFLMIKFTSFLFQHDLLVIILVNIVFPVCTTPTVGSRKLNIMSPSLGSMELMC